MFAFVFIELDFLAEVMILGGGGALLLPVRYVQFVLALIIGLDLEVLIETAFLADWSVVIWHNLNY